MVSPGPMGRVRMRTAEACLRLPSGFEIEAEKVLVRSSEEGCSREFDEPIFASNGRKAAPCVFTRTKLSQHGSRRTNWT
jgi:hypothetical protein